MKHRIVLLLALLMLLSFSGCGSSTSAPAQTAAPSPAPAQTQESVFTPEPESISTPEPAPTSAPSVFPLRRQPRLSTVSFANAGVANSHGAAILNNGKADAYARKKGLECTVHDPECG